MKSTLTSKYQTVIFLAIIIVGGVWLFVWLNNQVRAMKLSSVKQPIALTGNSICLSYKNANNLQNKECKWGVIANGGEHYALDVSAIPLKEITSTKNAKELHVEGIMVPMDLIEDASWAQYQIIGVIQAQKIKAL